MLGQQTVRSLVLVHDLVHTLDPAAALPDGWITRLTVHAVETGRLARELAAGAPWAGDAFVGGLLHEVGQLVLAASRPAAFARMLNAWDPDEQPLATAELAGFGVTHHEIGARRLNLWGLGATVTAAVASHSCLAEPDDAGSAVALAHAVVEHDLGAVCGQRPELPEKEWGGRAHDAIERWRRVRHPTAGRITPG